MIYYLTKYAVGTGKIQSFEATIRDDGGPGYVKRPGDSFSLFTVGRDVFEDPSAAIDDAEKRRQSKIKSLEKQILKLQKMRFSAGDIHQKDDA